MVHREIEVHKETEDLKENKEIRVLLVHKGIEGHRDFREIEALSGPKEIREKEENVDFKENQGYHPIPKK